jgi:hypothetical protein
MKSKTTLVARIVLFVCTVTVVAQAQPGDSEVELLSLTEASGVKLLKSFSGTPNGEGVVKTFEISVDSFDVACYWAPFQKYDLLQRANWYDGVNRQQPLAVTQVAQMKEGGQSVLFRLRDGQYLAVLPLTGPRSMGWLTGTDGKLLLKVGNLGTAKIEGGHPRRGLVATRQSLRRVSGSLGVGDAGRAHRRTRQDARREVDSRLSELRRFRHLGGVSH